MAIFGYERGHNGHNDSARPETCSYLSNLNHHLQFFSGLYLIFIHLLQFYEKKNELKKKENKKLINTPLIFYVWHFTFTLKSMYTHEFIIYIVHGWLLKYLNIIILKGLIKSFLLRFRFEYCSTNYLYILRHASLSWWLHEWMNEWKVF